MVVNWGRLCLGAVVWVLGLLFVGSHALGVASAEPSESRSVNPTPVPGNHARITHSESRRVVLNDHAGRSRSGVALKPKSDNPGPPQPSVQGLGLLASRSTKRASAVADVNYESHVSESGIAVDGRTIPDLGTSPGNYADTLKFSNCTGVVVDHSTIFGGKEDAIDAVRGSDLTFRNLTLVPNSNGITVKGAAANILIENVFFEKHGSSSDFEFGQFDNYWYVGRAPTRTITIKNVSSADGKPVVIKLWDAVIPVVIDSNVKIIRVPKLIWWPYFVVRAIQTRGLTNIFKPVESGTFVATK